MLVGLFSGLVAVLQLLQNVLQDSSITFPDLAKFDSQAYIERRVTHLTFEGQVVVRNFENKLQVSSRQNQALGRHQAPDFRNVLQNSVQMRRHRSLLQEFRFALGAEALETAIKAPGPYLLNVRVSPNENVYPMIPAGCAINEMVLGPAEPVEAVK